MSVTQFWNAMHVVNRTGTSMLLQVQAAGYKQLFSPSETSRNVPCRGAHDSYNINVPAYGSAVIGAGICRDGDFDQSAEVNFVGLGMLRFTGTTPVHSEDISQVVFWYGSPNVTAPTGVMWNFNHQELAVLTVTIS